ncbi:hypothetical protein N657DRAFT_358669 [Parathielavia appendiculata]|uniref:Uncharacterized protein n=1 Tax=Parathielavia appendiculata TaxID=2587402 RepID=A0AAN6U2L6_9PEZI|nr:hypothetical protein N657DRAFT_358669 [Parathielavia appendiculata]
MNSTKSSMSGLGQPRNCSQMQACQGSWTVATRYDPSSRTPMSNNQHRAQAPQWFSHGNIFLSDITFAEVTMRFACRALAVFSICIYSNRFLMRPRPDILVLESTLDVARSLAQFPTVPNRESPPRIPSQYDLPSETEDYRIRDNGGWPLLQTGVRVLGGGQGATLSGALGVRVSAFEKYL